jgi:uncharacterized protein DUF6101
MTFFLARRAKKGPQGDELRRQIKAAGLTSGVGSSRALRLDPHRLPTRYTVADERADARSCVIEIDREQVLLIRSVNGVRIRVRIPIDIFLGVAIRLIGSEGDVAITLEHHDPSLSVALRAGGFEDSAAEWQSWGRVLGLPLLIEDLDGTLRRPVEMIGALMSGEPRLRRRRKTPLRKRRPYFVSRRRGFGSGIASAVYRDEREIIAYE